MSVAGMDSGLHARRGAPCLVETWRALLGAFLEIFLGTLFGVLFGELMGALFGELFGVLVDASIAKISQQPTSNKPHAIEQNQHSAKHLELTARNDPLKQKATLFFWRACVGAGDGLEQCYRAHRFLEFCFAKLQIFGSLKFSSDEIEVTKVEGARKGSIFWRPGSGVHVLFVSESVDLSPVRTMWNIETKNLACTSIMCRFKIVARSGGRAACFNVRKIWDARKPVRIVSVTLCETGAAF